MTRTPYADGSALIITAQGCFPCKKTKEAFDKAGMTYHEKSLETLTEEEYKKYITSNNFGSAPVVFTMDDAWSGLQPGKLKALKG